MFHDGVERHESHQQTHTHTQPHLSTVVVSVLTGAGDGEAHAGRVPRADASNLAETTVGLPGKTGHAPTRDNALGTVSLRGSENVDALVLSTP